MSDSLDWLITKKLMNQLRTMVNIYSYSDTPVADVQLVRAKMRFKPESFPLLVVCPESPISDEQNQELLQSNLLPFVIWFFDGIEEDDNCEGVSFAERMGNYPAGIIKCLKSNVTLDDLVENITIEDWGFSVWSEPEKGIYHEGGYVLVNIQRTLPDPNDPFSYVYEEN